METYKRRKGMIYVKMILAMACLMALVGLFLMCTLVLTGCTLSFQNVDTHGTATDLIDENQTTSPNIEIKPKIPGAL